MLNKARSTKKASVAASSIESTGANGAALALEDGGNLAAILAKIIAAPATAAKQDTLIAAIGAPADAAWDGVAASASLIAIMKAIWAKLP